MRKFACRDVEGRAAGDQRTAREQALADFSDLQTRRLERFRHRRVIDREEQKSLISSLYRGFETGRDREPATRIFKRDTNNPPTVLDQRPDHIVVVTGVFSRRSAKRRAEQLTQSGKAVTLLELRPSPRFMQAVFTDGGYWYHCGGIFGKSDRQEPLITLRRFKSAAKQEIARINALRPVDTVEFIGLQL